MEVTYEPLGVIDQPQDVLRKLFSPHFVMTGPSLFVEQYHQALRSNAQQGLERSHTPCVHHTNSGDQALPIRAIGWGSCGVVYEQLGITHVTKRAINGNSALSEDCRLENDLNMHKAVEKAFAQVSTLVKVPRLYTYMSRKDRLCWTTHRQLLPEGDRIPEDLLITEHIPPIHLVARHALIDCCCPEELKVGARLQDSNDDCLVRLYLGKRRDRTTRLRPRRFFGLRNFPLCLDQMQELRLDIKGYATAMAEALAIMHWKAKIDAADVEFVLGGAPCLTHKALPGAENFTDLPVNHAKIVPIFQLETGATHIWLLDFNQCQPISMDEQGVDQAVKRFFDNDPYYPRPQSPEVKDILLWKAFESRYLEVSEALIGNNLPVLFIQRAKEAMVTRIAMKAEAAQRSDKYSDFDPDTRD